MTNQKETCLPLLTKKQDKPKDTCLSLLKNIRQTKRNLSVFTYEHKTNERKLVCLYIRTQDEPKETCSYLRTYDKTKETCLFLLTDMRQTIRNMSVFTYEQKTNQNTLVCS